MKKFADEYIIFLSYGRLFLAVMVCDLCFVVHGHRFDRVFFVVVVWLLLLFVLYIRIKKKHCSELTPDCMGD